MTQEIQVIEIPAMGKEIWKKVACEWQNGVKYLK